MSFNCWFSCKALELFGMTGLFTNVNHITQHGAWLVNNTPNKLLQHVNEKKDLK